VSSTRIFDEKRLKDLSFSLTYIIVLSFVPVSKFEKNSFIVCLFGRINIGDAFWISYKRSGYHELIGLLNLINLGSSTSRMMELLV